MFRRIIVVSVLLLTACRFAGGATLAFDSASDVVYADGWQAKDNGGTGFGQWTFAFSGTTTTLFHPPQFIDRGPLAGNSLGSPAFALTTSDRPLLTDTSEVHRTFDAPLAIGQTLSVDVDGSDLDPNAVASSIGNTFDLYGTDSSKRFSLFTNNLYNDNHWTAKGGIVDGVPDFDTGIPADSAFHIDFTIATADSYNLVLTPIGGGTPYVQLGAPLEGTPGVGINRVRFSNYGTGSSADGSKEFFFNNLSITGPDGTADFNRDNMIDAADYVVWRKHRLGDEAWRRWRTTFGETVADTGLLTGSVPEPANLILVQALAVSYMMVGCRSIRRKCG